MGIDKIFRLKEAESLIDVKQMAKVEQSILASLLSSQSIFDKIIQQIKEDDFLFKIHKIVFREICELRDSIDIFEESSKKEIMDSLIFLYNVDYFLARDIVDAKANENVDVDIVELQHYLKYKSEVMQDNNELHINYEDEYGEVYAVYKQNRLCEVYASNVFQLPEEICDTFSMSYKKFEKYIDNENHEVLFKSFETEPFDIAGIFVTKNTKEVENIKKLESWALKNDIFPSKREILCTTPFLIIEDIEIKSLPDEICNLNKLICVMFINNKLEYIPDDIYKLKKLTVLSICNNKVKKLPKKLFDMSKLTNLCLHANKLEILPSEIEKLKNLKILSISNNNISFLPKSIKNLKNLEELDIENTLISESDLKLLNLENLTKVTFDDRLLPFFLNNLHLLRNIDTINLAHSQYLKDDEVIKNLNLNLCFKKWIQDKDFQGHGCISLF